MEQQWPYEMFGIECDTGWKSLYQPIIDYIETYNKKHTDSKIEIHQIKEKFGGLRFYWQGENLSEEITNKIREMVHKAEETSYHTCEICGTTEDIGTIGTSWYRTVCKKCAQNIADSNKSTVIFRQTVVTKLQPKNVTV